MEIVGLGAIAGLIVAAACMMFYRKGVRDGMSVKKGVAPQTGFAQTVGFGKAQGGDEETMTMMKRYEAILSYDPYNSPQKTSFFGNPDGERV